ncbi:hypothetical protein B0H21DRAFT_29210 [Amylocystis lapponica]|nr:hypothetical protein B0H21DRAFT_29210 [Amylocystis lapponica]
MALPFTWRPVPVLCCSYDRSPYWFTILFHDMSVLLSHYPILTEGFNEAPGTLAGEFVHVVGRDVILKRFCTRSRDTRISLMGATHSNQGLARPCSTARQAWLPVNAVDSQDLTAHAVRMESRGAVHELVTVLHAKRISRPAASHQRRGECIWLPAVLFRDVDALRYTGLGCAGWRPLLLSAAEDNPARGTPHFALYAGAPAAKHGAARSHPLSVFGVILRYNVLRRPIFPYIPVSFSPTSHQHRLQGAPTLAPPFIRLSSSVPHAAPISRTRKAQ